MESFEEVKANLKEEKKFMRGDREYKKLDEVLSKLHRLRNEIWDFYCDQDPDSYGEPRHPLQLIDKPIMEAFKRVSRQQDRLVAKRKREGKKPSSWW